MSAAKTAKFNMFRKIYLRLLVSLTVVFLITTKAFSQEIKGKVTDIGTGESLIEATVTLANTAKKYTTSTGLDGSYIFKNIPEEELMLKP